MKEVLSVSDIESLIDKSKDVNAVIDFIGMTPLQYIYNVHGSVSTISFIKKYNPNVDIDIHMFGNCIYPSLLAEICRADDLWKLDKLKLIRLCAKKTKNINVCSKYGNSAAMNLLSGIKNITYVNTNIPTDIRKQIIKTIHTLLKYGTNPNLKDPSGNTILHHACFELSSYTYYPSHNKFYLKIIKLIIKYGGDITIENIHRQTPIIIVSSRNSFRKMNLEKKLLIYSMPTIIVN